MKNIGKKVILSQENAESLLGKGLATPKGIYIGKINEVLKEGLILDSGAYIPYKCCSNNYKVVELKEYIVEPEE